MSGGAGVLRSARGAGLLVLAGVATLAASGCPPKPPVARPYPPPSPADLAAVLATRHTAVRSMNARVRATSWLGGERVRATVLMLVTRAGQLRFEAEVTLQGTVATLATDGARFALLEVQKNELRVGPACPANVASLIRIPLDPVEVAGILLGDVAIDPLPPGSGDAGTLSWDPSHGDDVWTLPSPAGATHLAFHGDGADRALVGVVRDRPDGEQLWQTAYEDFSSHDVTAGTAGMTKVRLPARVRFAEGRASFDDGVEIQFKDRTLNVTPKPEDFVLRAPPGVTVKEVGCGSGG
jgi:hypothetical protein